MNFNNYPFMYLDSFKMHEFVLFIVKIDGYILFLGKGKHGLAECESADSSTSSRGAPAYTDCPSMYDTVKYSEIQIYNDDIQHMI